MATNNWCGILGIDQPDLNAVKTHRDANTYALLIATLLERGGQMTLVEVATRLEEVGVAHSDRKGSPVAVGDQGNLCVAPGTDDALRAMRRAVRARVEAERRRASARPEPAVIVSFQEAARQRRVERAETLATATRALVVRFPLKNPRTFALLDVEQRTIDTFIDEEVNELRRRLARYDIVGAEQARALLHSLEIEADGVRLAELSPPQKRKTLNKSGRTLKITTTLLVQGSCGIGRPFGDPKKLSAYLAQGDLTKLRRRLEADAKSLYALYEYGRLHRNLRLRWGFLDEYVAAPWANRDEQTFYELKSAALQGDMALEVVAGNAPGWRNPWSRGQRVSVHKDPSGWRMWLVDEAGRVIDDVDVQKARLVPKG